MSKNCSWCGAKGKHICPSLIYHDNKSKKNDRQEFIIRANKNFEIEWLGNNILIKEVFD
jgi:hypothetical protein